MAKMLKLAIVALVVYLVLANYETWVESIANIGQDLSRQDEQIGQGPCVSSAEQASEAFGRGMRDYASPPIDLDAWQDFLEQVKELVYRAETHCDCPRDSCVKAMEAISELNRLIEDFDGTLRGSSTSLNPARRQETINSILKRARELDRQGS